MLCYSIYLYTDRGNHNMEVHIMKFSVGMYVINMDYLAIVREVRPDGYLVIENPRIGKWIANPDNCKVYNA